MDCIFCEIANKKISADIISEDKDVVAFSDNNPQAPVHVLIIPRKHIETVNQLESDDVQLVGSMILKAKEIADQKGLSKSGYRLVLNCNKDGGQAVFHIHLHLLGGRQLQWPPG